MRRVAHVARPEHDRRQPVHVTLRSTLSCLRSQFVFPTVRLSLASLREREREFRVVQFSVQGNHVHLLVEASSKAALSSGLRALAIRTALRVNRLLMRHGKVWADRCHRRALTTPRAVRHALVYVLGNARKHHGGNAPAVDPCSSAPYFEGFRKFSVERPSPPTALHPALPMVSLCRPPPPVSRPRTWLLAVGWKRHGLLALSERPVG